MGNTYLILDKFGNKVDQSLFPQVACQFEGSNSSVIIRSPRKIVKASFVLGDNCNIYIGENIFIAENLYVWATASGSIFKIEQNCWIQSLNVSLHDEPNLKILIGKDCLFGSNNSIRSSDGHTIYDAVTNEILNKPTDIILHDHIWTGRNVEILKNSEIQSNSVIGMGSIVTKRFLEGNCVLAGRPAKIVKRGINWSFARTDLFNQVDKNAK